MPVRRRWTSDSVLNIAPNGDPVLVITSRAQRLVSRALDEGWAGPPFDPFRLADLLGIQLRTNTELLDARLVLYGDKPCIEFNPDRPRGRLRYSIAHEIAHTLFPDWHAAVRNRVKTGEARGSEAELESLCNVAAAEILMPFGTLAGLRSEDMSIARLLQLQRDLDVSTEALFIRVAQVSEFPCAMLVARADDTGSWLVEYSITSSNFAFPVTRGDRVPQNSVITQMRGIGHTLKGIERWSDSEEDVRIEVVGIPGAPGSPRPRVVAWVRPRGDGADQAQEWIDYLFGDATQPVGDGKKIIVQVVSDGALTWGGGGFAASVRRKYPAANDSFRNWTMNTGGNRLGRVHFYPASDDVEIASIVAQHGFGPSSVPRIRYEPLLEGLRLIATKARDEEATLHMPRIGSGMAGGSWARVEELLGIAFRELRLKVTIYDLPQMRRSSRS